MNIFTKFHKDWTIIVDFLLIAKFWAILLLFGPPSRSTYSKITFSCLSDATKLAKSLADKPFLKVATTLIFCPRSLASLSKIWDTFRSLDRGSGPHFRSITGWGLRKDDKIDCGGFGIDGFFPDPFGTCGIPEARRPIDRQISTEIWKKYKIIHSKLKSNIIEEIDLNPWQDFCILENHRFLSN